MSDQPQSPFFRLPRELRDSIYEHYAHDADGVFYDYASNQLRCKLVAEEMQFVAARANTITFLPGRSEADGIKYNDLDSKAGRFERLLQSARRMKMHILHHVAKGGCVTPAIVDEVAARFPSIARYYRKAYDGIKDGEQLYAPVGITAFDYKWRWQSSAAFCDALHYTLELAASHPRFDELAAAATATPYQDRGMMPPFLPGSHKAVLAWNPERSIIPSEDDLVLESYLTDPVLRDSVGSVDYPEPPVPVTWHFSATAVAADFLGRLPPATRMRIRMPIIIREEKRAVAYCESHTRAIAPYLCENRNLRVELHVGFWTNLVHPFWLEPMSHDTETGHIMDINMLRPLSDFLDELILVFNGLEPIKGLSVYIEGHLRESVAAWQRAKHAASLQDAMLHSDYMQQHQDFDRSKITHYVYSSNLGSLALKDRFQLPCDLPESFSLVVRQIIEGSSFIHFDGDAGTLWDIESTRAATRIWSPQEFSDQWTEEVTMSFITLPPGGVTAYMKLYELQALRSYSRPWVWTSPDGAQSVTYHPETLASDEVFTRHRRYIEPTNR